MDQSWLIPSLIWLLVGLIAVAIALGVMVFAARRMGVNGDGDDDHGHEHGETPAKPARPARGSKSEPLNLSLGDFHGLRLADFRNDKRALRDFGELVTVATLAVEGWKKLPSKLQGGQGIDVLVVREVRGGGFEARAIEVRTNNVSYNPETMSDERIAASLARLHDIGAFDTATLDELLRGLWQGPPVFRKEVWHHQLDSGVSTVMDVDETGRRTTSHLHDSADLMDALYQVIKQFDRKADYVDRPAVEAPPSDELVHAAIRRTKQSRSFMNAYSRAFAFRPKRRA